MDKTSAIFRISRPELSYHRKAFLEQCRLMGRNCTLQVPVERDLSDTTTSDKYYYDGTRLEYLLIIESDPSKKMLESFGFSKESTTTRPLIAHCPMYRYKSTDELKESEPSSSSGTESLESIASSRDLTYRLGTITSVDSQSDGYPRDTFEDVAISEGCLISIEFYESTTDVLKYTDYTVEQVLLSEDSNHYVVNLVPKRTLSTGAPKELQGDSGSKFILQDDD